MRLLIVPLVLFAAHSAKVCSSEEKATGAPAATAEAKGDAKVDAKAAIGRPRIGGTVAAAGDFSVEVALHEKGLVEAIVSDAQARLVSEGVKLSAILRTKGGATENVALSFVAPRGRFEGRAKAGVELAPGPVDVALDVAGKAATCQLQAAVALPEPELGGSVLAAGAFSAELIAKTNGQIDAFVKDSAGADVKGDAAAAFRVIASAKGGAREEIGLRFDGPRACFTGNAKAGVELVPGPIELVVDAKVGAGIGRLESVALEIEAAHGGQIVALGDYSVELVAKGPELRAFVLDASGKAHAAGDLDLKLFVGAGAGTALALKWDAPSLSYVGTVAGKANVALEPIRVSLVASGKAFTGAVASLDAAAKARGKLDVSAKLGGDAKLDADAKLGAGAKLAADAKAKLDQSAKAGASIAKGASASVKVTPPKVSVKQSAGASAKAGGGAKASAGISIGMK
jgi:hypothetical protein